MFRNISIGTIIAVILIVYWWKQDHPAQPEPVQAPMHQGVLIKRDAFA